MNSFLVIYELDLVGESVITVMTFNIVSITVFEAMLFSGMLGPLLFIGEH